LVANYPPDVVATPRRLALASATSVVLVAVGDQVLEFGIELVRVAVPIDQRSVRIALQRAVGLLRSSRAISSRIVTISSVFVRSPLRGGRFFRGHYPAVF